MISTIISFVLIRNINFINMHSILIYSKYLISLNVYNLYILYCNDSLVSK